MQKPFISDVKKLRSQARKDMQKGPVTDNYGGDVKQTISILQSVLATEIVCVLRYSQNAIAANGLSSEGVKDEFLAHAAEEQIHVNQTAERINQLGGSPDYNPETLTTRSMAEYKIGDNLVEMIRENLIAERIACAHYRDLVAYFSDKDPTTRRMLESFLEKEEEHANDMHDLLVAHEGKPMLAH